MRSFSPTVVRKQLRMQFESRGCSRVGTKSGLAIGHIMAVRLVHSHSPEIPDAGQQSRAFQVFSGFRIFTTEFRGVPKQPMRCSRVLKKFSSWKEQKPSRR